MQILKRIIYHREKDCRYHLLLMITHLTSARNGLKTSTLLSLLMRIRKENLSWKFDDSSTTIGQDKERSKAGICASSTIFREIKSSQSQAKRVNCSRRSVLFGDVTIPRVARLFQKERLAVRDLWLEAPPFTVGNRIILPRTQFSMEESSVVWRWWRVWDVHSFIVWWLGRCDGEIKFGVRSYLNTTSGRLSKSLHSLKIVLCIQKLWRLPRYP